MPLTNPITRMTLKFSESGGARRDIEFYDLGSRQPNPQAQGRWLYCPLLYDGEAVCSRDVHKIQPGPEVSGVVDLSAVCASTTGISVPSSAVCLFVKPSCPDGCLAGGAHGFDF